MEAALQFNFALQLSWARLSLAWLSFGFESEMRLGVADDRVGQRKKNAVMRKMYSRSKKKELEKIKAPTFRDSGLFLFVDVWPWPGP